MNSSDIKDIAISYGADIVGIAPVERFAQSPMGHSPVDLLDACKSVIVLAGVLPQHTLDKDTFTYTAIRNGMVEKMNSAAITLTKYLRKSKFTAKSIGSLSGKWENGRFMGPISLKHAGELAGIGIVARNYLLTNKQYGNMLWMSAVLTSAELQPDELVKYEMCDNCYTCVEACPASALQNEHFFSQKDCRRVCYITKGGTLDLKCWECRKVCPYRFGINN